MGMNNNFLERSNRKDLEPGVIYHSKNSGDYVYLDEAGYKYYENLGVRRRMVRIKFVDTGYEMDAQFSNAYNGKVKDPYYPNIFGKGYFGLAKDFTKQEYDMWFKMIERCYNPKCEAYKNYGAIGITVDPRWFSFENFLEDLKELPGYHESKYGKDKYNLDKDIKQKDIPKGQRVYSKDTCMLVPASVNTRAMFMDNSDKRSSSYIGIHKLGDTGNYQSRIMINSIDCFLGTYDDEVAAANMYNHVVGKINNGYGVTFNKVPRIMSIPECLKHKVGRFHKINLPDGVYIKEIEDYNNAGIRTQPKTTYYTPAAAYSVYFNPYNYGYYCNYNNYIPPMFIPQPVMMCSATNEDENIRKARCLNRYGIEFI